MHCTPSRSKTRKSRSPLSSMNVILLRATMQARRLSLRWFFFQKPRSSGTHGAVSCPCRIHLSSEGVSVNLIFHIFSLIAPKQRRGAVAEGARWDGSYLVHFWRNGCASHNVAGFRVTLFC